MSNINQTSKEIKKKLSFNDYSTQPEKKHSDTPANTNNAKMAKQQAAKTPSASIDMPAHRHVDKTQRRVNGDDASCKDCALVSGHASMPTFGENDKPEQQLDASKKVKVTYYLTDDDHMLLTNIYINRLQKRMKTDKSAIIADAIKLLYSKEINNL